MAAIETQNLKVVLASQAVAPTTAKTIGKIGFGEGSNLPTPYDTALTKPYIKQIAGYTVNADGSLSFRYTLEYGEANGKIIKEIGLYGNDGTTLVAREVRDTIIKDADTAIEGTITIIL
jgi:hypothetical protein